MVKKLYNVSVHTYFKIELHAQHRQRIVFRGFCYFNSVAIAAKQMREKLKMKRIMILDWVSINHVT